MKAQHRISIAALTVLLTGVLAPTAVHAKAWTQPEGNGYAKVWMRGIFGSSAFLTDGAVEPSESYQDISLRHYAEYGVADGWTALTYGTPAGWATYADSSTPYVGPLAVGLRRGILDGPLQVAAEVHYGYVTGFGEADQAPEGSEFAYIPTVETHYAHGELQAGYGFSWGWTSLSAGARWQSRAELDPVITASAQVGFMVGDSVLLDAHFGLYEPLGDITTVNVAGAGQTRYLGMGIGASWWVTESIGLALGADGAAYAASNAGTPSFTAGVEARF